MNPIPLEPARWTRRRWLHTIGAVFALQIGLVAYLGQRDQRPPERPIFRTAIQMIVDESAAQQLAALTASEDPTLLALPHLQGFSGAAWLRFAPLAFQPEQWDEPPHGLALADRSLGSTFSRFLVTNAVSPLLVPEKPIPPLPRYEPHFPNEPVQAQSRLRMEGDLAARPLVAPLQLKSWAHSEILSNSVVQIVVDAGGSTFSPVLLTGCGLDEADLYALKLASSAHFRPLPGDANGREGAGHLAWGKLIFQWHTLPVPATNLSATASEP